jgi:hypothetical protein
LTGLEIHSRIFVLLFIRLHTHTHIACLIIIIVDKRRKNSLLKITFYRILLSVGQLKMSVIAKLIQSSRAPALAAQYRFYSAAG